MFSGRTDFDAADAEIAGLASGICAFLEIIFCFWEGAFLARRLDSAVVVASAGSSWRAATVFAEICAKLFSRSRETVSGMLALRVSWSCGDISTFWRPGAGEAAASRGVFASVCLFNGTVCGNSDFTFSFSAASGCGEGIVNTGASAGSFAFGVGVSK